MSLIPGLVLFLGAITTVSLIGWDTNQNRKPITKAEMQLSVGSKPSKDQKKRRTLFYRG